ncbi:MAG: hypothetical protein V1659_00555 [Candidatus Woesearchaeota archaeon]
MKKPWGKKRTYRWKFYQVPGSDNLFFFQTYGLDPSVKACPRALQDFLVAPDPVASAEYRGFRTGFITTYLIGANPGLLKAAAAMKWKTIEIRRLPGSAEESVLESHVDEDLFGPVPESPQTRNAHQVHMLGEEADTTYCIRSRHIDLDSIRPGLTDLFKAMTRDDVAEFCHYKPAANPPEDFCAGYTLVDRIEFTPHYVVWPPKRHQLVREGKGAFPDFAGLCRLKIGIDFSKGCLANTSPEGIYNPENRCKYCYAFNNGPPFLYTGYSFDQATLIQRINQFACQLGLAPDAPLFLRLGQTTEVFVPRSLRHFSGFIDNLDIALDALAELSCERPIRAALPAKCLEFEKPLAKKLIRANTVLLASNGYQQLEPGIVGHGFTPQKRLEELLRFAEAGVVSVVYIATDITRGPEHMQDDAKIAMDFFGQHKDVLGLQFLDMRLTRREDAGLIGGDSWDSLKYSSNVNFLGSHGKWYLNKQDHLCPRETHPYFLGVIGNNRGDVRLCSTHVKNKAERRCGMCFMDRVGR